MTPSEVRRPFEWFRALTEVPGVVWAPPADLAVDSRLAEARPVPDEGSFSPLGVKWVDGGGRPIADNALYQSPAELVLQDRWRVGDTADEFRAQTDPAEAVRVACQAIALPGTRYDYHQALSWLSHVEGVPGPLVERTLQADIGLVLGDPAGAVISPWSAMRGSDAEFLLFEDSAPIVGLINLYVAEGFLVEASAAEKLLDRLPAAATSRQRYWRRPDEVMGALTGLKP